MSHLIRSLILIIALAITARVRAEQMIENAGAQSPPTELRQPARPGVARRDLYYYRLGACVGQLLANKGMSIPIPGQSAAGDPTFKAAAKNARIACSESFRAAANAAPSASPTPSPSPSVTP